MCQLRVSEGVVSELQLLGLVGRMCSCTLCCVCDYQAFLLMSCMRYGFVDVLYQTRICGCHMSSKHFCDGLYNCFKHPLETTSYVRQDYTKSKEITSNMREMTLKMDPPIV